MSSSIPAQTKELIVTIIHMFYPSAKIYLFGSYARGDQTNSSDLDIAVDAQEKMDLSDKDRIAQRNCMGKVIHKKEQLLKVLQATIDTLNLHLNPPTTATDIEKAAYMTSTIKNFELLYEVLWKYFKALLLEKYGTDVAGSKEILRTCKTHSLINEDELIILLKMVTLRNNAAHVYDQVMAKDLCKKISKDLPTIEAIIIKTTH